VLVVALVGAVKFLLVISSHGYFGDVLEGGGGAVDYFRDETALEISRLSVRRKLILLTGN
jgi:hypothetical protein